MIKKQIETSEEQAIKKLYKIHDFAFNSKNINSVLKGKYAVDLFQLYAYAEDINYNDKTLIKMINNLYDKMFKDREAIK